MQYIRKTIVDHPIQEVAELHRNPTILKELTPPWAYVNFHRIAPQSENSIVEMTIKLGFLSVFWRAKHTEVTTLTGFSDIQEQGPFESWKHVHHFHELNDNKTEIHDHIKAQFKTGLKGLVGRFIWIGIPSLFLFRHWKTKKLLRKFHIEETNLAFVEK